MTCRATRRERVLVSRGVHPHYRADDPRPTSGAASSSTRSRWSPTAPAAGTTDLAALERMLADPDRPVAGVIAAQPNFLGLLEPMPEIGRLAHAAGALFVAVVEPVSLAVLAPPGAYGADIAAGEGQPLGIAPQYGGPYLGILASTDALVRQIPGRLVGHDDRPRRQARLRDDDARARAGHPPRQGGQQHLHQPGAARPGRVDLPRDDRPARAARRRRAGRQPAPPSSRRRWPRSAPSGSTPARTSTSSPSASPTRATVHRRLLDARRPGRARPGRRRARRPEPRRRAAGVRDGGHDVGRDRRRFAGALSAVLGPTIATIAGRGGPHERRRRAASSRPCSSVAGRAAAAARSRTRPRTPSTASRPTARRTVPPALPELNEPDVVRHYVNLSQLNYAVDTGFYPLGSCTMKFNPKLNEWAARLPGFANLHPLAPDEVAQGTLAAAVGAGAARSPRSPACAR